VVRFSFLFFLFFVRCGAVWCCGMELTMEGERVNLGRTCCYRYCNPSGNGVILHRYGSLSIVVLVQHEVRLCCWVVCASVG